ncbi:MAG: hypothetical protein HYY21_08135 [Candidatus Tectomicrobia bacterium]|nr:hypothetical protein [Candidatus Tectomicrobia bacterium]
MSLTTEKLAGLILGFLREGPAHFEDILLRFRDVPYRDILRAWGRLREEGLLGREVETGRYVAKNGREAGEEGRG